LPRDLTYGASAPVKRGFAILGDRLFMVTLDAHLLAMDSRTGAILWDIQMADYKIGYSATLAPLIVKNKGDHASALKEHAVLITSRAERVARTSTK
jgi:glucose dehydrogenase